MREQVKELGTAIVHKWGMLASMSFQFHFTAKIDDTAWQFLENLLPHDRLDFLLKACLSWSKNVLEEQETPFQAMIPAMDHQHCVHLSMGLRLDICHTEKAARVHWHLAPLPFLMMQSFPEEESSPMPVCNVVCLMRLNSLFSGMGAALAAIPFESMPRSERTVLWKCFILAARLHKQCRH